MRKFSHFFVLLLLIPILVALVAPMSAPAATSTFTFVTMGDAQGSTTKFPNTVNQIATLDPDLVIFNGDLELNGVTSTEMNTMVAPIKNAGLFNQTFMVRGNHDNHVTNSAVLWEHYFETAPNIKVPPEGVTDYVSLNSSSDQLDYSFVYGNAMFIGLDYPANIIDYLTSSQLSFLDARLTHGESLGLDHAFIYFHKPLYCVTSTECECTSKADASCTQSDLVTVLNKHPIVSATFHGHEHILGWVHMSPARVATLKDSFEEFFTSPAGGYTDNQYLYPSRIDYAYQNMGESQGFTAISVNGASFTFSIYKVGITAPVWSRTFTNGYRPTSTSTPTFTPSTTFTTTSTPTDTPTPTLTETETQTATPTFTPFPSETETGTHTPSPTETAGPTSTATETGSSTPTPTETSTPTATSTATSTPTPTFHPGAKNFWIYLPLVTW